MEGPPEIVGDGHEGHDLLLGAAGQPGQEPPIAWMPSCELPAIRITASGMREVGTAPPVREAVTDGSLMKFETLNGSPHDDRLHLSTSQVTSVASAD